MRFGLGRCGGDETWAEGLNSLSDRGRFWEPGSDLQPQSDENSLALQEKEGKLKAAFQ